MFESPEDMALSADILCLAVCICEILNKTCLHDRSVHYTTSQPFWLKIVNQHCIIFLHFSVLFKGLDVCFQDVNSIQNTADEMELFALVNRKYKHFFIKQEHQLAFRTYDYVEVSLNVFVLCACLLLSTVGYRRCRN